MQKQHENGVMSFFQVQFFSEAAENGWITSAREYDVFYDRFSVRIAGGEIVVLFLGYYLSFNVTEEGGLFLNDSSSPFDLEQGHKPLEAKSYVSMIQFQPVQKVACI